MPFSRREARQTPSAAAANNRHKYRRQPRSSHLPVKKSLWHSSLTYQSTRGSRQPEARYKYLPRWVQTQKSECATGQSALPSRQTTSRACQVRKVPKPDSRTATSRAIRSTSRSEYKPRQLVGNRFSTPQTGGILARSDRCFPVQSSIMNMARESSGNLLRMSR